MQHNTHTGTRRQSALPPDPAGPVRRIPLHWSFMKTVSLLSLAMFSMHNAFSQDETSAQPLRVVPAVDFSRYAGTWYEIARLPNRFQQNCAGEVTATYTLTEEGELGVVNRCRTADGEFTSAEGVARRADPDGPDAKLKVRFAPAFLSFLPFVWGDYWIIELAPDYRYVVIGEPKREYLWVLARTPRLEEEVLQNALGRALAQGYALGDLIRTPQAD